jgi:hypothetical protein
MVALVGPLATIDGESRQARKGATVIVKSCAGMWLARDTTQIPPSVTFAYLRRVCDYCLCIMLRCNITGFMKAQSNELSSFSP